jgi:hypothetical protein
MEKRPRLLVATPFLVPLTITVTPGMELPVASFTVPSTFTACANVTIPHDKKRRKREKGKSHFLTWEMQADTLVCCFIMGII